MPASIDPTVADVERLCADSYSKHPVIYFSVLPDQLNPCKSKIWMIICETQMLDTAYHNTLALKELAKLLLLGPLLGSFLPRLEPPRPLLIHFRSRGHSICVNAWEIRSWLMNTRDDVLEVE